MHMITSIIVFICLSSHQFRGVLLHPQTNTSPSGDSESWNTLRQAIEAGNVDESQRLLLAGADVNATDNNNGNSALLLAAEKGHERIVRLLLEHGAYIDALNKFNNTALILAVWAGFDKTAELLIQGGANVNVLGDSGTVLTHAAEKGRKNIVKLLLENGADINTQNRYKNSALILAVWAEFDNVAELLIQKGADVNVLGENNYTALMWAAKKGRENIVELLIEQRGIGKSLQNNNNDTAMILALREGYDKVAELLVQRGAFVNVDGQNRMSALMWAAKKGFENTVRLIIDYGSYLDNKDDNNFSALLHAANNGHDGVVRILNEKMKDSWAKILYPDDEPTLVFAATKGLERAVEVLIRNGANINASKNGTTALMAAAKNGNEKIIRTIIQNNATNINAIDADGHTALDAVVTSSERHEKLRNLLMEYGAEYRGVELYRKTSEKVCQLYTNLTARWRYGTETRLFDGSLAEEGEFPWMVALGYLDKRYKLSFQCGGSIISDTFVLTAAHCVKDIQRPVVARFGKVSLTENDFRVENQNIQEIILHPKYSLRTKKNDIALIRLIERLSFSELIQPICLETDIKDVDTNVDVIVSGWGTTNSGKTSNELLKISLKTMPVAECNTNLLDYNRKRNLASFRNGIDESQYCAHDPVGKKDSCQGDSGGPLQTIQSYPTPAKVVGVVSFGIGCGRGRPGIYTRVAHYIEWIGSHVWPNGTIETPRININSI